MAPPLWPPGSARAELPLDGVEPRGQRTVVPPASPGSKACGRLLEARDNRRTRESTVCQGGDGARAERPETHGPCLGAGEPWRDLWLLGQVPWGQHARGHDTKRDRTRVLNRIKGLLAGYGMRMALPGDVETQLDAVRQWDGTPRPAALCARLKRAWQKVQGLTEQIGSLEAERRVALRHSEERVLEQVRQLARIIHQPNHRSEKRCRAPH